MTALNASMMATTSRGWVEHRSKLRHYPATIRLMWIVAGIHDCLKRGEIQQARARCALALAATDQSAIDMGNWSLAQEFLPELPPPYQSFTNRRAPDQSEQVSTRLTDERFIEIMMWRLKDRDSYLEWRRRLNQSAKPKPQPGLLNRDSLPKPGPKGAAKPKPKAKASGGFRTERSLDGGKFLNSLFAALRPERSVPGARASTVHADIGTFVLRPSVGLARIESLFPVCC